MPQIIGLVRILASPLDHLNLVNAMGSDMGKVRMGCMDAGPVAAAALISLGQKAAVIPGRLNRFGTFTMTHLMPRQMALSLFGSKMSKTMDPAILQLTVPAYPSYIG